MGERYRDHISFSDLHQKGHVQLDHLPVVSNRVCTHCCGTLKTCLLLQHISDRYYHRSGQGKTFQGQPDVTRKVSVGRALWSSILASHELQFTRHNTPR